MDWDRYFLNLADAVSLKSKDPSTKVGCLLVGTGHQIVSTGYNGFARGVDEQVSQRWERPEKYEWVVHAEMNAILNAARSGVSTLDCTAYVQTHPCSRCASALVQAGIRIVGIDHEGKVPHMHIDKTDLMRADRIFREAGVRVYVVYSNGYINEI